MEIKNRIYFDHSATTPIDKKVLSSMLPFFEGDFANASSIHSDGQKALSAVSVARKNVADFFNCKPEEMIFTSGATESDNLAIFGLVRALQKKSSEKLHIVTSSIEHPAVLECFNALEKEESVEVTYLPVNEKGVVEIEELKKAIKKNTVLVSLMYVNSEVGSAQPIVQVGELIQKINEKRINGKSKSMPIYFHTDATQAVNFFSCDVKILGVDLLSCSGHKIYGPKGVGGLFVKKGTPLHPLVLGGHHEGGLRSGTLNVPGIVGFGEATKLIQKSQSQNNEDISKLRDLLVGGVMEKISNVVLNTDRKNATPSHAHFSFLGVEGEAILLDLDFEGISVSTGSACAAGSLQTSHVLAAMGISDEIAHGAIRFTLGKRNSEKDVQRVLKVLARILQRLRKMTPKE